MASRKEQKERLRQERLEREQAAATAAARRRRMGYGVAGFLVAAVVIALGVVVLSGGGGGGGTSASAQSEWPSGSVPAKKIDDLDAAVKAAGCVLEHPKSEGRGHTETKVTYKTAPPTSGSHHPIPTSDAAYLKTPAPYEGLVHALEHGRVLYWFKPTVPDNVKGSLRKLYDEDPALVILTPNSRPMPYPIAATAWTRLLGCPAWNDRVPDAFRAFAKAYRLKGPEYFPNKE
jgi:hypothetical protein